MLRPSQSPLCPSRAAARARSVRPAIAALLAAVASLALSPASASAIAAEELCGPFAEPYAVAAAEGGAHEGGVAASEGAGASAGAIVPLSESPAARSAPASGEALLALPKRPDGSLPTDFELGPGARIADHYWSPVLCARVALVVGRPGATLAELVPRVPPTATVVAHDVYATAGVAVRPAAAAAATEEETAGAARPGEGAGPARPSEPDPYRALQYGIDRVGAEAAWALTRGAGARVALLDSAPDARHRDLAGVRVLALAPGPPASPATHGTLLAGVVRAVAGNGFGIAGVAPEVDLVAIPVCTPVGAAASDACRLYDVLRGVDRAFELEADVVNLSLVGPPNPLLERAMARLEQLGSVAVAAAGNEGTDAPRYPAAYPSVIGVGAIAKDGALFARGNRGPSVEILGPGVEVISTVPGDAFAFGDGTSLAAAHVSGELALLVAALRHPIQARTALFQAAEVARARDADLSKPPAIAPACAALPGRC